MSRLIDTDVLIHAIRGTPKAVAVLEALTDRRISVITRLELLQGVRDRRSFRALKSFLVDFRFLDVPVTERVGLRAGLLLETHALGDGLALSDALIAATALEEGLPLLTGNLKHFRKLNGLELVVFKP